MGSCAVARRRNVPPLVCQLSLRRHDLCFHVIRTMHDDGGSRHQWIVRSEPLAFGIWRKAKKPAPRLEAYQTRVALLPLPLIVEALAYLRSHSCIIWQDRLRAVSIGCSPRLVQDES
jgi:hypothetical protein